jgi:probable HAF family extracellular repeat protein
MFFANLFGQRKYQQHSRRSRDKRATPRRLRLESLEVRCVLSYAITDLGTLPGYEASHAEDINAVGQVVGYTYDLDTHSIRAFLWDESAGMIDLGTLGGASSQATAINDLGQVAGTASAPTGPQHIFLINPEDSDGDGNPDRWFRDNDLDGRNDLMIDLGALIDFTGEAVSINNLGQVLGNSGGVPFLWQDGVMTELSVLNASGSNGVWVNVVSFVAYDINDSGEVVGQATFEYIDYWTGASDYRTEAAMWRDGMLSSLGSLNGGYSVAAAINDARQVAGTSSYGYGDQVCYYYGGDGDDGSGWGWSWCEDYPYWVERAFLGSTMLSMAGLPIDAASYAYDVNNAGQVVGLVAPVGGSAASVLWQDGARITLPVESAVAINATGQIVGQTAGHALLLTPTVPPPTLTITDASGIEGNSGTTAFVFSVTLSAAYDQAVTVEFATQGGGSATTGSDYEAADGTLIFAPSETTKTITVRVIGDRLAESSETFFVNVTTGDAFVADSQGAGTIVDDEPRISIGDVTKTEGRPGKKTLFTFTVTLSAAYDQPVTMSFRTVDGTATTTGGDYVANTGTLTFAPGETTKTITIEVKGDSKKEASETFYLDLFDLSSNALFTKNRGTGTIVNDD